MAIPDFQSVMLPLIKILGDGQELTMREVTDLLAQSFHLTDQEREELLPSGQQSVFSNRVGWAKSHLKEAGLLENPLRGRVRISDLGRQVLAEKPAAINIIMVYLEEVAVLKVAPIAPLTGRSHGERIPGVHSVTLAPLMTHRT